MPTVLGLIRSDAGNPQSDPESSLGPIFGGDAPADGLDVAAHDPQTDPEVLVAVAALVERLVTAGVVALRPRGSSQ